MAFYSILPESFSTVETWMVRIFLALACLTVGPWLMILAYDIVLYIWRSATYELPGFGGRARGRARPRAPSLSERPSGHKRRFSIAGGPRNPSEQGDVATTTSSKHSANGTTARPMHDVVEDEG
ncbi:hypothetical protein D0862_13745 [Hortaea werneckii]|uniref:Uncharacterized protein n=1 Tax=Hortaea werneckii TaxID=91943 RepID=A0A3M7EJV2_HORWE|nr:hypothetical protein D0862_13745 [Hortaea werneckii]